MSNTNARSIYESCKNKLNIEFRKGKELTGWYLLNGKKFARISVPKGRKDIAPKTRASIAAQLKLTDEQLDGLVDCWLSGAAYELLQRNSIPR